MTAAMTADPMTIAPDAPLVDAAKVLETYRISSLPVVEGTELVGMLTVTDLLRAFVDKMRRSPHEAPRNNGERRRSSRAG